MTESGRYTRFNYHIRDWMSILLLAGHSYREIGKIIGKHHTSVSRELQRNSDYKNVYNPVEANILAKERKKQKRGYKISSNIKLKNFIYSKLQDTWSPDAIAGYLKKYRFCYTVSHETIYKYIYRCNRKWIKLLARGHRKRYRRTGQYRNRRKVRIPDRLSIDERPKSIDKRIILGHFEADLMVTRQSMEGVLVLVERKTRLIRLVKLRRRISVNVKNGIIKSLRYYSSKVKSITYDNGTENVLHGKVNKALNCKSYFCNPYHSWEKGSVENAIGLLRRFIPKKSDLSIFTQKSLNRIAGLINNRPRKLLNYNSPKQLFKKEWCTEC